MARYLGFLKILTEVRRLIAKSSHANSGVAKRGGATIAKLALGIVLYGILPLDLIPDFIPVLGQMDDAVAIMILLSLIAVMYMQAKKKETIKDMSQSPKKLLAGK